MEATEMKEIVNLINTRPLSLSDTYPYVEQQEKVILEKVDKDISYLARTMHTPLKVVIMGEVKAGKSTLMNAIVEEDVSNVGVTETTAVIMEIVYGDEKRATLYKVNGEEEKLSIEELNNRLESNRGNEEYFAGLEKVRCTYPLNQLQEIELVDTPGLETITTANQNTTTDYIQKADVVLWVLSVHHLGQAGIDDKIMEVAQFGKPIILLVNRIDQLGKDQTVDDVLNFIEDEYGYITDDVFTLSAFKALEGIKSQDDSLYKESNLPVVLNYLKENIERSSVEVKKESVKSSTTQLLEHEYSAMIIFRERIKLITDIIESQSTDINDYTKELSRFISNEIEHWTQFNLLKDEEEQILSFLDSDNSKEAEQLLKKISQRQYLQKSIESFYDQLSSKVNAKLTEYIKTMDSKIREEEKVAVKKMTSLLSEFETEEMVSSGNYQNTHADLIEGAKTGAMISGTYGVATALYAAVLGPAAAYIGVGAAISSVLPPVLLAGVASGIVWKLVTKNSGKKQLTNEVRNKLNEIRKKTAEAMKEPEEKLISDAEVFFDNAFENMCAVILKGTTVDSLEKDNDNIEKYTDQLKNALDELKQSSHLRIIK